MIDTSIGLLTLLDHQLEYSVPVVSQKWTSLLKIRSKKQIARQDFLAWFILTSPLSFVTFLLRYLKIPSYIEKQSFRVSFIHFYSWLTCSESASHSLAS